MPSSLISERQKSIESEWARLIPGRQSTIRNHDRKPVQSVRTGSNVTAIAATPAPELKQEALGLLVPRPFRSRAASNWLRSTAADFALIGINWLVIGALLVPLRQAFPQIRTFRFDSGSPLSLIGIALLHAALITLLGYSEGLYSATARLRQQSLALGKSIFLATTVLGIGYAFQTPWTTIVLIATSGVFHFGALFTWRWQASYQESASDSRTHARNVLIVGAGPIGRRLATYLDTHPENGRAVSGFLDDERLSSDRVLGGFGDLARVARSGFVDEIILAAPQDRDAALRLLSEAQHLKLDVEIVPELFGRKPVSAEVEHIGELPIICMHAERLPEIGLAIKRALDVCGAAAALLMLGPLMALIAAAIKFNSPGAIFYSAKRGGRKGRVFACHKFRTMISDADSQKSALRQNNQRSGPFFKMAGDPRITRVGRFLRRYSLDELPQLWNVLRGEMSLVGPRPHPLDDLAAYGIEHLARLDVTPGITGLWQVTARRDPSFARGMELDREYIRTWSLAMDLRILARTFVAVMTGSGE